MSSRPRLDGIAALRFGIGALGLATLTLATIGLAAAFNDHTLLKTDEVAQVVESAGLPVEVSIVLGLWIPMLTAALTAIFVFVRRPRDPIAMVFALMMITLTAYSTRSLSVVSEVVPGIGWIGPVNSVFAFATFSYFLLVFPRARFASRAAAIFWILSTALVASRPGFAATLPLRRVSSETTALDRGYLIGFTVMFLGLAVAQIVRYRRATGEARLQMKWVMLPLALFAAYVTLTLVVPSIFVEMSPTWFGVATLSAIPLGLAFPICIARGVLKYRLYDIDVVINRALVYGTLTAVLAACYVGLVFAFQALLSPITAESDLAIAGSTLAVAGLFRPVRSQVQGFIDRRFYRQKFDVQQTLEEFGHGIRDEVDLASLSMRLHRVVHDTMQPAHISLWLRGTP